MDIPAAQHINSVSSQSHNKDSHLIYAASEHRRGSNHPCLHIGFFLLPHPCHVMNGEINPTEIPRESCDLEKCQPLVYGWE